MERDSILYQQYAAILKEELRPAMGCTEPIALAYAGALARKLLGAEPEKVLVAVSGNIIKNVKSVVVPNTGGLRGIAAAVCAGGCGAMAAKERIIVEAENLIGARPGDTVNIEGQTGKVALAIGLVYVLPLILFFLGYFLCEGLWGAGVPAAIGGFLLGILIAVIVGRGQRKKGKEISFRIVSFANE